MVTKIGKFWKIYDRNGMNYGQPQVRAKNFREALRKAEEIYGKDAWISYAGRRRYESIKNIGKVV